MNEDFEVLNTINDYMFNLISGIKKAVEHFQVGEERKGYELISPITEGIQWIGESLIITKDIHKQELDIQNMNKILNEIVEALENGDYILIGDLFQYELTPILEDIRINIEKVIED